MDSAPIPNRSPITGRPVALVACGVLAVILNAGAIGLATETSSLLAGVETSANESPHRSAVMLVSVPSEPALPTIAHDAGPPVATRATPHRPPQNLPTARTGAAATESEPPQQVLFYTFREVDSPAFPESDWNLDVESLDSIGVQRLVFEVLVSDRGQVVGCMVLDPPNLADDVKRQLETRLSETPLLPALRGGRLVASVRRIELLVTAAPPEMQALVPAYRP